MWTWIGVVEPLSAYAHATARDNEAEPVVPLNPDQLEAIRGGCIEYSS